MKKALLSVLFLILSFTASNACQVNATWQLELPNYINLELRILAIPPEGTINEPRRAPIRRPTIGYDGNTLYLYGQFGDLTLQLLTITTTAKSTWSTSRCATNITTRPIRFSTATARCIRTARNMPCPTDPIRNPSSPRWTCTIN